MTWLSNYPTILRVISLVLLSSSTDRYSDSNSNMQSEQDQYFCPFTITHPDNDTSKNTFNNVWTKTNITIPWYY